jgi:hypothetical protein
LGEGDRAGGVHRAKHLAVLVDHFDLRNEDLFIGAVDGRLFLFLPASAAAVVDAHW